MTLLLSPVTDALAAIREHFQHYPNDDASETPEQVREMAELAAKFVPVSKALLAYAEAVGGRPGIAIWICHLRFWDIDIRCGTF